jgi:hypothetical protein
MGVSTWVNADSTGTAGTVSFLRNAVGGLGVSGTNSGLFDLGLVMNVDTSLLHLRGQVAVGPAVLEVIDPAAFTLDAWHHVALSVDGAQIRLFKDGVEVAARDYTFDLLNTPAVQFLTVGGGVTFDETTGDRLLDTSNAFVGRLDDIALATRNLTTEEVSKIFAAGNAGQPITSVVLTPPTNEDVEVDIARNGNNLTISWEGAGRLQSSDTVDGTYTDVQGVTGNSYTTTATGTMRFFQVVQ